MKIPCPECGAEVPHRPVLQQQCRRCGHRWHRPLDPPLEFELQRAEGDEVQGPYDRNRLGEMLYAGDLTGRERVRPLGAVGHWVPLSDQPQFHDILELLGIRHAPAARIQGWQSSRPAPAPTPAAATPAAGTPAARTPLSAATTTGEHPSMAGARPNRAVSLPPPTPVARPEPAKEEGGSRPLVILIIGVLVIAAVALYFLVSKLG